MTDLHNQTTTNIQEKCIKYNEKIRMQAQKNDEEVFNRSIYPEIFK